VQQQSTNNQNIQVTVQVDNALMSTGYSVTTQADYHLSLNDFYILKSPIRKYDAYVTTILSIGLGLLISSGGRYIAQSLGYNAQVEPYEIIGGLAALMLALIGYFIGLFIFNPKKAVFSKIEQHFKDNPPTRSIVGAKEK